MVNLATTYLTLDLKNPIIASPSPLCENLDHIRRMEDTGCAAVVLPSLFQEQITLQDHELDPHLAKKRNYAEAAGYYPLLSEYNLGPDGYVEHVRRAKEAVSIPIIASLNGVSAGPWLDYAKRIDEAGADALELNLYFIPTDPKLSGAKIETMFVDLVRAARELVKIPIAVKVGPYFSSLPHIARRFDEAGADGLVLFNRFYQPDLDVENLDVDPELDLSTAHELRLRLRWAAILYGRIKADIALTGGVHDARGVIKCVMAGARAAQMASALLLHGVGFVEAVLNDLKKWMEDHRCDSLDALRGVMSQKNVIEPAAFERASYLRVVSTYQRRHPDLM